MVFADNLFYHMVDPSGFIDEKGSPVDTHELAAHKFFKAPYAVGFCNMITGIYQQRERQAEFLLKFFMALFIVITDTQYNDACLL